MKNFDLSAFCRTQKGPFYLYDLDGLLDRYDQMHAILGDQFQVHYAVKANHHPAILRELGRRGCGFDVVSGGELDVVLAAGASADRIVFSGVGKTVDEIRKAIDAGVRQINVESLPELHRIREVARSKKKKAKVAFRVNPDVDADTHPYIRTGFRENKFGMDFETARTAVDQVLGWKDDVQLVGFSIHIGSQIRNIQAFTDAGEKVKELVSKFNLLAGEPISLDLGGGLGIDYADGNLEKDMALFQDYVATLKAFTAKCRDLFQGPYLLEPGRFLVARFGWLLSQVQYVKRTPFKNFLIVDAGMHLLMRPALYQAQHRIEPLPGLRPYTEAKEVFDVVGPICESSDVLGHERLMPTDIQEYDWICIHDAGAYGAVMANDYNLRPKAPEVVVWKGKVL